MLTSMDTTAPHEPATVDAAHQSQLRGHKGGPPVPAVRPVKDSVEGRRDAHQRQGLHHGRRPRPHRGGAALPALDLHAPTLPPALDLHADDLAKRSHLPLPVLGGMFALLIAALVWCLFRCCRRRFFGEAAVRAEKRKEGILIFQRSTGITTNLCCSIALTTFICIVSPGVGDCDNHPDPADRLQHDAPDGSATPRQQHTSLIDGHTLKPTTTSYGSTATPRRQRGGSDWS